jgi:hypothetical protein
MNRDDFQQLADLHLLHAQALMEARLYSGAYYLCGYVVECALKACICKRTNQFDFYASPDDARKAWSHKFGDLVKISGLEEELNAARQSDVALGVNWKTVANWSEDSRYEQQGQKEANDLMAAIADSNHGVLSCIKRYW